MPPAHRLLLGILLAAGLTSRSAAEPSARQLAFFESKVRPVLVNRCYDCHGDGNRESGLNLDSLTGLLRGGTRGPSIVPGDPTKSLLILAVNHADQLHMPPKSKIPTSEIAALTEWIKMGAPWPDSESVAISPSADIDEMEITDQHRSFWSFQRPVKAALPSVKATQWPCSPIDYFVLAKLEQAGLQPAPRADRRTLIRRVTFDLIGLPPTIQEVHEFLADESPDAYARLIERLLDSPRYGERWGRRWLDVARYADSNGMDENLAYANAFRYRDYVINALNKDKPFDRFVAEQLAGDLLPDDELSDSAERLTATGFLCIGPKMLAEDDPVKMQMDIIDEQLDTVGRAFLGLTLGCARCHDHKFDPIPTADYYSLAGIFKSTKTMENHKVVAVWQERPIGEPAVLAQRAARQKDVDTVQSQIDALTKKANDQLLATARARAGDYFRAAVEKLRLRRHADKLLIDGKPHAHSLQETNTIVREAETIERGNLSRLRDGYGAGIGVIAGPGGKNTGQFDIEVKKPGWYILLTRYAAAQSRPTNFLVGEVVAISGGVAAVTGSWYPDTQKWFVEGAVWLDAGKVVFGLERDGPIPHIDKLVFVPAPADFQQHEPATGLHAAFVSQWFEYLRTPESNVRTLAEAFEQADEPSSLRDLLNDPQGPLRLPGKPELLYADATRKQLAQLRAAKSEAQKKMPALPVVMAVSDAKPENIKIHIRGSHVTLGREVPRRVLAVLAPDRQPMPRSSSGRLELARWMTESDHPLTARVFVNRVWQGHFGEGLVRSPDNFGRLGRLPTHPKLLDYLAVRFVEDGWSTKSLHRMIMLSAAYQMSAAHNERAAQIDPENELLWRMNRRRLEAEAVRDSVLAIGGSLDLAMGGSRLPTENRKYVTSTANVDPVAYQSQRRSVYMPVVRSALYDVFQAFDFADPSASNGARETTTVAPQALFMLNSELVAEQTRALARELLATEVADERRIEIAFERLFGRLPKDSETAKSITYIQRFEAALQQSETDAAHRRLRAWQSLCRALLATNEFIYVE